MHKTARRPYSQRDDELARKIYNHLRNDLLIHETGEFRTYTEIAREVGTGNRNLGNALYYIQDECAKKGYPTYTVFVVRKTRNGRGLPGSGCNVMTRAEVDEAIGQIRKIDWPVDPWW